MESGQRIALTCPWWAWNHTRVRTALNMALVKHWPVVVGGLFRAEKSSDHHPTSWEALAGRLRRNPRNIIRTAGGEYSLTHEILLGIASVFNVPVAELLPDHATWIEEAVAFLCENDGLARPSVAAYTAYCLCHGDLDGDDLNRSALENVLVKQNAGADRKQLRHAIMAVAKSLGPILESIDADIRRKEKDDASGFQ